MAATAASGSSGDGFAVALTAAAQRERTHLRVARRLRHELGLEIAAERQHGAFA